MLPIDEIRTFFRRASVFDALTDGEVEACRRFLRERRFAGGEALFREDDAGASLFILLDGEVVVDIRGPRGEPLRVGRLGHGDVIGEQACLDPSRRSATVTATSDTLALELTRAELDRMSRELPRVASLLLGVIIHELTDRLHAVDRRVDAELRLDVSPPASLPQRFQPVTIIPPQTTAWQRLASRLRGAP
ncbi:MAG: cyclic nucleotide-binding domain-containing protein [Deltaproteobacteria bacterium]|jgi:CRP-like cAMP-binding protein|nr:cyclic nucleotide-binding domain-containing protein [Deltaproteobacteria bacterium]MBK7066820.1 cyclic nucleotide-binding domain-containing protein [Deltaproteobacteria bacterium]MBK8691794.1 cyclic nucleotide-binding domain-containing protein [Deltaproteobacteria bacterium]